ncbi:hypothetical protein JWG39_02555 [Desulforhopalus vacuolatus]|uniref:hypothetical protein n=1 Tax=Desulforhopalus vacuolatus TaxID=40414 RepID=UPI001964AA5E|nr:hypothetical protein [Desulforhopalus vacuolatus]MBM9518698.1 hypothetical protein [Desulforhopalus vacuolatus]
MPFSLSIGEFKGRGMGDRRKETGDREKQKTEQRKTFCQRIKALNMRIKAKNFKKDFKIKQRIAVVLSLLVLWSVKDVIEETAMKRFDQRQNRYWQGTGICNGGTLQGHGRGSNF